MMTSEQRYFFDTTGCLHLPSALDATELAAAHAAVHGYIDTPPEELPPGFAAHGGGYAHSLAFAKALEALTLHPSTWPIVEELTADKPRVVSGSLRVSTWDDFGFGPLHCSREEFGPQTPRYHVTDGRIYCDYVVCFFYLTDVRPGDGGLVVVPGSHKSEFARPPDFYQPGDDGAEPEPHSAVLSLTPKAGDVVVISELLTHGNKIWQPQDRDRRFIIMRCVPQFIGVSDGNVAFPFSDEILERLSRETRELAEFGPWGRIKDIVNRDVVTLS
jgi:ectoine hydroxylase-related dioxygenase (phytanoyl-CoA dioxygenase family)